MSSTEQTPSTPYRWVRLSKHCADTGDTPEAVHSRRKKRKWIDGVHCRVRDGNLYVNPEAYNKWVEGNNPEGEDPSTTPEA